MRARHLRQEREALESGDSPALSRGGRRVLEEVKVNLEEESSRADRALEVKHFTV